MFVEGREKDKILDVMWKFIEDEDVWGLCLRGTAETSRSFCTYVGLYPRLNLKGLELVINDTSGLISANNLYRLVLNLNIPNGFIDPRKVQIGVSKREIELKYALKHAPVSLLGIDLYRKTGDESVALFCPVGIHHEEALTEFQWRARVGKLRFN